MIDEKLISAGIITATQVEDREKRLSDELEYTINNFTVNMTEKFNEEFKRGYQEGMKEAFKLVRDYLTKMENQ